MNQHAYSNHIDALRAIALLAHNSSDLNMRMNAGSLEWIAKELDNGIRTHMPRVYVSERIQNEEAQLAAAKAHFQ